MFLFILTAKFHLMGEFRGLEVLNSDAGGLERLCISCLTHKKISF